MQKGCEQFYRGVANQIFVNLELLHIDTIPYQRIDGYKNVITIIGNHPKKILDSLAVHLTKYSWWYCQHVRPVYIVLNDITIRLHTTKWIVWAWMNHAAQSQGPRASEHAGRDLFSLQRSWDVSSPRPDRKRRLKSSRILILKHSSLMSHRSRRKFTDSINDFTKNPKHT